MVVSSHTVVACLIILMITEKLQRTVRLEINPIFTKNVLRSLGLMTDFSSIHLFISFHHVKHCISYCFSHITVNNNVNKVT